MARKLMKKTFLNGLLLATTACFLTAGCGNSIKEKMGLKRTAPDEFQVVTRAPLEIPPELRDTGTVSNLPTPRPGAPRPQEISATQKAKAALLGQSEDDLKQEALSQIQSNNTPKSDEPLSVSETILIDKMTQGKTLPNSDQLRSQLDQEQEDYIAENQPVIQKLGIVDDYVQQRQMLDPTKEAARLRKTNSATRVTGNPEAKAILEQASDVEQVESEEETPSTIEDILFNEINSSTETSPDLDETNNEDISSDDTSYEEDEYIEDNSSDFDERLRNTRPNIPDTD